MRYDSAGITVVESRHAVWSGADGWRIAATGPQEFGADLALYQVRMVRRLEDGRVAVAHGSEREVLVFSPAGQLLTRYGRRGSGPGEFGEFSRVLAGPADTLVAFDITNLRVTLLGPDGGLGRVLELPTADGTPLLVEGVFGDGSLLGTPFGGPPAGVGLVRRQRELWRAGRAGEPAVRLVAFPELEMFFFQHMPRPIAFRRPFFGRTSYYLASGDRLIRASSDRYEVHIHATTGEQVGIHRRAHESRTFGPTDVAALIDQAVAAHANPEARPSLRRVLEELPRSGTVPVLGWPDYAVQYGPALQVDDEDNLWIADYSMPGEVRNSRTVLSPTGEWLGTVVLPPGFAPHHIGRDFVLGVWRDELDVEHVQMYRLLKSSVN